MDFFMIEWTRLWLMVCAVCMGCEPAKAEDILQDQTLWLSVWQAQHEIQALHSEESDSRPTRVSPQQGAEKTDPLLQPEESSRVLFLILFAVIAVCLSLSVAVHDFAERQMLQKWTLMSKEKERWYAAAQHDLWQPLQSVQLYAQALLEAPAHQQQSLINGLQLASQCVDDFMGHLRFRLDGHLPATDGGLPAQADVHELLESLAAEFMPLAQMRHVVLRYRPYQATVLIHQGSVQRMARNLLTNALHYTPAGGRVLLACQKRGGVLWLLCIDNGTGMSPAQVESCFDAFTRFGASHRNKLGLGLFSFKQLAIQHNMPTRLQSMLGQGTLVGFGMPLQGFSKRL